MSASQWQDESVVKRVYVQLKVQCSNPSLSGQKFADANVQVRCTPYYAEKRSQLPQVFDCLNFHPPSSDLRYPETDGVLI